MESSPHLKNYNQLTRRLIDERQAIVHEDFMFDNENCDFDVDEKTEQFYEADHVTTDSNSHLPAES